MENERLTQLTQDVVDPRREGRNNSGLSADDVSDVLCILHPCTPASFKLVATTAKRAPQHVLQHEDYANYPYDVSPSLADEQETFIIPTDSSNPPMDLALRFSSRTVQPLMGFSVGRSPQMCDVVVPTDTHKRISNFHFAIQINDGGVLMLSDMSTNGTVVDDVLLKGKKNPSNRTRMLTSGSIIQILSPTPAECLKFIVRFPSRDGFVAEYEAKFQEYLRRIATIHAQQGNKQAQHLLTPSFRPHSVAVRAPLAHSQFGMHWSGGDKYNVVGLIGKGAFASVYQLATKSDGQLYAAKELEKRKFMKNGILDRKLDNEMHIMQSLSHPNIVRYIDFQDVTKHMYIIMEFVAGGDLQQYLNLGTPLPEAMAKRMANQVFDALNYLHYKKITHRDIKPDNILIADLDPETFTIKLSDFGLSKVVGNDDTFLKTFCGTLLYCAPEVFPHYDAHVAIKGTKRPRKGPAQQPTKFHSYSQSVDVWSFGAVLWYSLCLNPPFEGVTDANGRGMFDKIMMTPLDASMLVKYGVSDEAVALLVKMLNTDPAARPTPQSCLRHAWFGYAATDEDQPAVGLGVITEEAEADASPNGALDVSNLKQSINELQNSQDSEVSINSGDLNFFDPRQSKRFKPDDDHAYRDTGDMIDSSPEVVYQTLPMANGAAGANKANKPKLFGEISRSDLQQAAFSQPPEVATGHTESSDGSIEQEERSRSSHQDAQQSLTRSSTDEAQSLMGAESHLRDMHMADSPWSHNSRGSGASEPRTPGAGSAQDSPVKSPISAKVDITPRPVAPVRINRQINLPIPPSFWWDPDDPSTHTVEYASKVSGHDFAAQPVFSHAPDSDATRSSHFQSAKSRETSPLPISKGPSPSTELAPRQPPSPVPEPASTFTPPASSSATAAVASDAPRQGRYGRLVSTPDSFAQITIALDSRVTTWGRGAGNTHVYPDAADTRVPKTGLVIYFHAAGIDAHTTQVDDWTTLPGLYTGLATHSSNPLRINGGALLRRCADPADPQPYGRVYTGDTIDVWAPGRDGSPGLRFECEFYFGQGATTRAPGQEFFVEMGAKGKGKGAAVR